jgi:ferrochelatase
VPAYDAFLLLSFGGPEGPADVLPFLENVTRGRGVPRERLAEVAEHYHAYGGVSPINSQCREMLTAIGGAFADAGIDLPLYWGNRNWHPFITDTVRKLADDGAEHVIAFVTSAYSSYSACRQYLDDIERAMAAVGPRAPRIDKIRPYFNHPGFIEPFAAHTEAARQALPADVRDDARLVFTAHSVPLGMAAASGSVTAGTSLATVTGGRYVTELKEASRLISERSRGACLPYDLVYQSRSGPPGQPWLVPDVRDHIASLASSGVPAVVVVPVGFVTDHMEVVHDLDVEAAKAAASLGLPLSRAAAPGPSPRFARMIAELVAERLSGAAPLALGAMGPAPWPCPADCCRYTRPARPA